MTQEDVARQWLEKAEHDLLNARNTLATMGDDCPYDTVCFHAQQAVEKTLKALLSRQGILFTKAHDISVLVDLLPKDKRPTLSLDEQSRLTRYAVESRYPGVYEELTRDEAQDALCLALKVKEFALGHC